LSFEASRRTAATAFAALALAPLVSACGSATPQLSGKPSSVRPCARAGAKQRVYRHVVWIWFENQTFDYIIGPPGSSAAKRAPFFNALARLCGLATNFHNITHPSLPNYIAATVGSDEGIREDCLPSQCSVSAPSIFERLMEEGKGWRVYAEAMPEPCAHEDSGSYLTRHNPAPYLRSIAESCRRFDVPLGSETSGPFGSALDRAALPSFTFVVPDACNDMHDCSVSRGDDWLSRWVTRIVSSKAYRRGDVVLFVTFDEGESHAPKNCVVHASDRDCRIPLIVVSRGTRAGTRSDRFFTHYSLLRTTEELLHVRRKLRLARPSPSMRAAFGL